MKIGILGWRRNTLPEYCNKVKKLCHYLAKNKCTIITGAGTGIMNSANKGAFLINKNLSIGITMPILDKEQEQNPNILKENIHLYDTFAERKKYLMHFNDCNIFFPGGMGILDEFVI